jgi:hypothetical protein
VRFPEMICERCSKQYLDADGVWRYVDRSASNYLVFSAGVRSFKAESL